MSFSKPNTSAATLTKTRVTPAPISGLCVTCLDGCRGTCEVGQSALRGREVLYPRPFGRITAGSEKDYPVDFSHFNIQGSCTGAVGIEPDPDVALFSNVDITTTLGADHGMSLQMPFFTGALGSTEIARVNWEGVAIGAALCGTIVVVGENVCGMDPEAELRNGLIVRSPEMERRVSTFREWHNGHGAILVQCNVEDLRLGVPEYVIRELGVQAIELKWGQGAKDIGGEVKLPSLERASQLYERGYLVFPPPNDDGYRQAYEAGTFKEFERHSRLGMVEEEAFIQEVERLRGLGATYITLKTGAYRPADLARAVKCASEARVDLLTVDGAGGGTGMSPWRMMNEWGIPVIYLESLLYTFLQRLKAKGAFIPSCAIAGGISLEDHIFKALALGAPYVQAVCMGRATLTAAMVGKTHGERLRKECGDDHARYRHKLLKTFAGAVKLKESYGEAFEHIPPAAIGMYTYYDRLATGLRQLMAGARKFALRYLDRNDIMALTREAAKVSGIPYVMEADQEEVERILG